MNKVAILTSGGDAPGMNPCLRSFVRSALHFGFEVYGIKNGFRGLYDEEIFLMNSSSVSDIINKGGTKLGTARFEEMIDNADVQKECVSKLLNLGIEALVVIGGDGSYRGALSLAQYGLKVICLPGTIDNDVAGSAYTIGFDTALNTIVDALDKLRDTSTSHQRCSIVEVMGRHCGDLALYSGIANGAEMIITLENTYTMDEISKLVVESFEQGKRHFMIIVTENVLDTMQLAKYIEEKTGYNARTTVLGHIQRGGSPSALDRFVATKFGYLAAKCLHNKEYNLCLGSDGHQFWSTPIKEALAQKKETHALDFEINTVIR